MNCISRANFVHIRKQHVACFQRIVLENVNENQNNSEKLNKTAKEHWFAL